MLAYSLSYIVLRVTESKYMTCLRNRVTGQVPADTRTLILSLFAIYGKISPTKLREKYDLVTTMVHEIVEPIGTIFNALDHLREIAELAN